MTIYMGYKDLPALYDYWVRTGLEYKIPYFFFVPYAKWRGCFIDDYLEGVKKFSTLHLYTSVNEHNEINGFIQFGTPAFAWNKEGQRYLNPSLLVIRHLCFNPSVPDVGEELLKAALQEKEKHQGNKYGSSFLSSIIKIMERRGYKQIHTDTPINNTRAQKYYESLNFLNCGITRDYILPKEAYTIN